MYYYSVAIESSIAAGKVIMGIYEKDFQIDFKNDNSTNQNSIG